MPPISLLQSTVFKRVLWASAAFVALALLVLWVLGGLLIAAVDRTQWAQIEDEKAAFLDLVEAQGLDTTIAEWFPEDDRFWEEDWLYENLEENTPVWVIRGSDGQVLAGFDGFIVEDERATVILEHPEIDTQLRASEIALPDGHWGGVGLFIAEDRFFLQWFLQMATYALIGIALPLSLVIGFFLSRSVFRRIARISQTAQAVADGALSDRAPDTGRGDEFDRLSGGINHMLDQLQVLNQNIESVSVGVAHDLKTPLANIGGRLELIRRDLANPAAAQAHVEAAEGYLAEVLRIFDALLRLGEVESGRRKAGFGDVDLSDLVRDLAEAYKAVFEDAQKSLSVEVQPDQWILGDAELLQQMLFNLLENALEHSRDAAQVFVQLTRDGDQVVLRVGDDGPGISPADRDRIFDRFYRADSSRGSKGSGLGLSLVKSIADLHGAALALAPGTGAVFVMSFPSRRDED